MCNRRLEELCARRIAAHDAIERNDARRGELGGRRNEIGMDKPNRVGTPALATRGLQNDDFHEVGKIIARALQPDFEGARTELAERVTAIVDRFPLYAHLGTPAPV